MTFEYHFAPQKLIYENSNIAAYHTVSTRLDILVESVPPKKYYEDQLMAISSGNWHSLIFVIFLGVGNAGVQFLQRTGVGNDYV